jgi:hypothetical protein
MELYFTCPVTKEVFGSEDYSLEQGHTITESADGARELQGMILLHQPCPFCGKMHRYRAQEVLCPLSRGNNE